MARQSPEAAANPQSAIMNKLALWVFPLGVLVGGPFLPIAILLYWVSNNIWTYAQQHIVFRRIDQEEEEKKQAAIARRADNAPKPGARPDLTKKKKKSATATDGSSSADEPEIVEGVVEDSASDQVSGDGSAAGTSKPKPGARPQSNRGKSPKRKRR